MSDLYDVAVLTTQKDVIGLKEWARGSTPGIPARAHDLRLRVVGIGMGSMWIQLIEEAHHQLDMWSPIGVLSYSGNQLLKWLKGIAEIRSLNADTAKKKAETEQIQEETEASRLCREQDEALPSVAVPRLREIREHLRVVDAEEEDAEVV